MKVRHPSLSSVAARKALSHINAPEFDQVFRAIDLNANLFDSLATLHATPDPSLTKESRALKYKNQFDRALKAAQLQSEKAMGALDDLERKLRDKAEMDAGLHTPYPDHVLQEIRSALRSMPQKDRDRAIQEAATRGDMATIKAVITAPSSVLTGTITAPVETLVSEMVAKATPDLQSQIEAIEQAATFLDLAASAFVDGASDMREPVLEQAAQEQANAISEAERTLQAALNGHTTTVDSSGGVEVETGIAAHETNAE